MKSPREVLEGCGHARRRNHGERKESGDKLVADGVKFPGANERLLKCGPCVTCFAFGIDEQSVKMV